MNIATPTTEAQPIAADTWLIPNIAPSGPGTFIAANSMLIRGEQPIIVDTGAPIHRDHWYEMVFSLVDPPRRPVDLPSHDDGDHTGSLHDARPPRREHGRHVDRRHLRHAHDRRRPPRRRPAP
jgi:hypothetical protein